MTPMAQHPQSAPGGCGHPDHATPLPTSRKDSPGPTQLYPKAPFPPHHKRGPHLAPGSCCLPSASDLQRGGGKAWVTGRQESPAAPTMELMVGT